MTQITVYEGIPNAIQQKNEIELLEWLTKPTFFFIDNKQTRTLLISGLIHGNEPTGFRAIIIELKRLSETKTNHPFNLLFFIANLKAAQGKNPYSSRYTEAQTDFNRIWKEDSTELFVQEAKDYISSFNLIGHVDLHNNSGANPVYTVITQLREDILELANYLCDKHFYIDLEFGAFIEYTAKKIPSITVECGKRLTPEADKAGNEIIQKTYSYFTKKIKNEPVIVKKGKIYCDPITVKIRKETLFSTDGSRAPFMVRKDIETLNFTKIKAGTELGRVKNNEQPLQIEKKGKDITNEWIDVRDNLVMIKKEAVILMATSDAPNITKDCLLYLGRERGAE
jgi:succinylglutamate desuccinylase